MTAPHDDRRRAVRLLLGGAVAAAVPVRGIAATPSATTADKAPALALLLEARTVPEPAALARPVPARAPAAAVARLAEAEARRAAMQDVGDRLHEAWSDLERARAAAGKVASGASNAMMVAGGAVDVGNRLFESGVWDMALALRAEGRQAWQAMQKASRAHGEAFDALAAAPADPAQRVAALRSAADSAKAREEARQRLLAVRRRHAAWVRLVREPAQAADDAVRRWTTIQSELAADTGTAQSRWRQAARSGAALRRAAEGPAVRRGLDAGVLQALGDGLAAEPPWTLGRLAPALPEPSLADRIGLHEMIQRQLDRAEAAVERAADAQAWMAMTLRDLNAGAACGAEGCARFDAEAQAARREVAEAADRFDRDRREEEALAGALREGPRRWDEALRTLNGRDTALREQVATFARAAVATLTSEQQQLQSFAAPALAAETEALREWTRAWRAVHGTDPRLYRAVQPLAATAAPGLGFDMPAGAAGSDWGGVGGHAVHRLREIHTEPEGFGVYTYVLVLTRMDTGREAVRQRLQRIERTVRDLVPALEVPDAQRKAFNAFVVPTGDQPRAGDGVAYDVSLAQQLARHLPMGWHLPAGIREARLSRPGPFLLSMPVRAAQAQPDSPMLFADLSDTPPLAVADVVTAYMKGLELPDLREVAVRGWRPPVGLTVATTLVRVSQTTGELFSAFFPSAVAAPR